MLKYYFITWFILLCDSRDIYAYHTEDTTRILIANINVQIETTQALNDLYNFKFTKAEQQFRWVIQKYAWHPLGYFLLGLSQWWKIMPNSYNESYDDSFLAYMDTTIFVAKNLYKKAPEYRVEAAFFLAAANGFKGRLYTQGTKKNWIKAAAAGKTALNYLEKSKSKKQLSPELLFGDALYNYFTVWIADNYPTIKPILWFFPEGDKELGLEQLRKVAYNAFYTRTEAMVWLMRIFSGYEEKPARALRIAEYLHNTYPDNPYFHRYYAKTLYENGFFKSTTKVCTTILDRIDSGKVGYDANSGKYAAYYLGKIAQSKNVTQKAKERYSLAVGYATRVGDQESGIYLFSLLELGDIYSQEGDKENAMRYFKQLMSLTRRRDAIFKQAKKNWQALKRAKKNKK